MDRLVNPLAESVSLARHTKQSSQGIEATAIELGALQHAAHTAAERIKRAARFGLWEGSEDRHPGAVSRFDDDARGLTSSPGRSVPRDSR